jgi:hypothetical protein
MVWKNQNLVLYHGTHSIATQRIRQEGFRLDKSRTKLDFGRGIYATTNERQALIWASKSARKFNLRNKGRTQPVVLRTDVDRSRLSELTILFFLRPEQDYWELIQHCRTGATHAKGDNDWYDVVAGPLAKYGLLEVYRNRDQVSFHTKESCPLLYNSVRW